MFLSTWSTTIKPTLRLDDGLPFAEEQGQEAGTGMELAVAVTQASGTMLPANKSTLICP